MWSRLTEVFVRERACLSLFDFHDRVALQWTGISLRCLLNPGVASRGSELRFRGSCLPIDFVDNRTKFHRNRKDA